MNMFQSFYDELKRPATAVAILLAIFGAVLSVYLYLKGAKSGDVYYEVRQVLAFDQTTASSVGGDILEPFRVVDSNGNTVHRNIYAANIDVWNGGNDEIKKIDVRTPFRVDMSDNMKRGNVVMYGQTNSNRDGFRLLPGAIIDWDHFDPGEGFRIRVLYASGKQEKVSISGYALNTSTVTDTSERTRLLKIYVFASLSAILVALFLGSSLYSIKNRAVVWGVEYNYFASIFANVFETPLKYIFFVLGFLLAMSGFFVDIFLKIPKPLFVQP